MKFDLQERTCTFSINFIKLCRTYKYDFIDNIILKQIIRSATSIGANYFEADEAYSRKDFKHKLSISRKECKETIYWLNLLKNISKENHPQISILSKEARELNLIFSSIIKKLN